MHIHVAPSLKEENIDDHFGKSDFQSKLKVENSTAIAKLVKICCFCFTFMTIEFIGGYIAGSLAVMKSISSLTSPDFSSSCSPFSLHPVLPTSP